MNHQFPWMAALLAALLTSGCGGNDMPELGTVSGRITLDDKPLADARVIFEPEGHRPSLGRTTSSGHYNLNYTLDAPGAVPGKHTVRITTGEADQEGQAAAELIPMQYNYASELEATVEPGPNEINFDLTSQGQIMQPANIPK